MCEESACLVPPLEQTQNGPSDTRLSSGNASVAISYNGEALVGFHEDALSQAAVGKAQIILAIVLGLSLAIDCSEITILGFILPAAELHLCIDEHRKGWLVSITLLALAVGSLAWGILGDHLGRRRALISALSVAGLFSAVATVMPTYGTFMTARFCSGLGVAGAFPLSTSYMLETCSRATRTRYAAFLHSFWPLGAVYTAFLAHLTLPTVGIEIVEDNREHWSSWHKFLILSIVPIIICIIGLIWASESPRYLLEASREVEALAVYQRLHRLNKAHTQYGLTELELPGRSAYRERPVSLSRNVFVQGYGTLKETFQRISSPTHFRTTIILALLHLILGFVYTGIATVTSNSLKEYKDWEYAKHTRHLGNQNFTGVTFNETIENLKYTNSIFKNVTFTNLNFIHVEFFNCIIDDTDFINVKSSMSFFLNSTIKDSRFVDTDLTNHFINCNLENNSFMSLISDCVVDLDYNIYLNELYQHTLFWCVVLFLLLNMIGFLMQDASRSRATILIFVTSSVCSTTIFFATNVWGVLVSECLLKIGTICALHVLTLSIVEAYPCHLRCTAAGIMRSLFHLASLCAIPIYSLFGIAFLLFPAIICISLLFIGGVIATKLQDNRKVLL